MNIFKPYVKRTLITVFALLCTSPTFAGGLIVYEIGTPDMGLASAGYAARAQDAATVMTNPAGMTRLCRSELMLGPEVLYGHLRFSPDSSTTIPGNDGGNGIGWFPGGGAYYVNAGSANWKWGLGVYGNFGTVLTYNGDWVGRYHATKATLLDITIAPALAYRINGMWSIGAALNTVYGMLSTTGAVNNDPLGFFNTPDGQFKVKDETWSFGGTFGVLFEPTDFTRFGITYTTKTELNFSSKLRLTDTLPVIIPGGSFTTPLDLAMQVPQGVMASFFHELNACWSILGNLGWQDWSEFGRIDVDVGSAHPASFTTDIQSKDTWHIALGAQYDLSKTWRLSFGTAYDTKMLPDSSLSVTLPVSDAWRLGFGVQYFMCKNFDMGFGYTLVWSGDLPIDQRGGVLLGHLEGSFDNTSIQYFGINFNFKL